MGKRIDLTGQRFGRLVVKKYSHANNRRYAMWHVKCDCGHEKNIMGFNLIHEHTKSCGCLKYNKPNGHGMSKTPIYQIWRGMKMRCLNKNDSAYKYYGARRITVCDRWLQFENFYKDMGDKPEGLTIDRIDNNGNYEPRNCKWSTPMEQANNMRNNIILTHNGVTMTLSQWARKLGIGYDTLRKRIKNGWPVKEILFAPIQIPLSRGSRK